MSSHEDKVSSFAEMLGADREIAHSFLEAHAWDVEAATSAFFESGGAPPGASSTSSTGSAVAQGGSNSGLKRPLATSNSDAVSRIAAEHGVDLETARAILDAQGPGGVGGGGGDDDASRWGGDEDGVRAPIAPTQGRLFEHPASDPFLNHQFGNQPARSVHGFRNFENESRRLEAEAREVAKRRADAGAAGLGTSSASFLPPARGGAGAGEHPSKSRKSNGSMDVDSGGEAFYSDGDSAPGDGDNRDAPAPAPAPSSSAAREKNLHALFEPPRELLFIGTFDDARALAKQKGLWVLVNIQEDAEFFSYVLNRDLWQNDIIREIITSNFVFFQHDKGDQEALTYARFYKPTKFPHIAVIDPRTGEQVLHLDLKTRANENDPNDLRACFFDKVNDFLESNTIQPQPLPLPTSRSHQPAPHQPAPQQTAPQQTAPQQPPRAPAPAAASVAKFAALEAEPASDASDVAHVRLRLPNGKTAPDRRFSATAMVEQLYSYVNSLVPEAQVKAFDIQMPGGISLMSMQDQSLQSAGVTKVLLTTKWI